MAQRLKTDWILFLTVVAMVSFGVLILYSASSSLPAQEVQLSSQEKLV